MMRNIIYALLFVLLPFAVMAGEYDVVLANFNFNGNSPTSSVETVYGNLTDWDISTSGTNARIISGWTQVTADGSIGGTTVNSKDPTNPSALYQSFTVTVAGLGRDTILNLTSISFDYIYYQALGFSIALYSNLSGLTGTGDALVSTTVPNSSSVNITLPLSVDLTSNVVFSGLTNGAVVEFRIYLADTSTNVPSRLHKLDNIILNGTVVTPKSTAIMIQ